MDARIVIYWAVVGIPLAWGVIHTLESAVVLFK
jgi:hypothetical protein